MHNRNGDEVFKEYAFVVTKADVLEFRNRLLSEINAEPDAYHPDDVKKVQENNEFCRRYIRHKKLNIDNAVAMAKHSLQWRKSFGVHDITESMFPEEFFTSGALYPFNTDKFGSHIMMLRVKNHRKQSGLIVEMKKFIVFFIERILYEMDSIRITFVFDCNEAGIGNVDLELIKFIISIFKEYYPWALGYIVVYDMPWLLNAAWKIIKGWLPSDGIDRIIFTNKNTILEYIDKDNLPVRMGGNDTYEYEYKPGEGFGKRCTVTQFTPVPLE